MQEGMHRLKLIFFFFSAMIASHADDASPPIFANCPDCFEQIEAATDHLVRQFPVSEFHYVFVGRSPVPIEADLESRGVTNFTRIPLTDAAGHSRRSRSDLKSWLAANIPQASAIDAKKVLIVDFADTGVSLTVVQELVHEIYLERGGRSVEVLAFEGPYSIPRRYISKFGKLPYHRFEVGAALAEVLVDHQAKRFSSTPRFPPGAAPVGASNFDRNQFEKLKAWILERRSSQSATETDCTRSFRKISGEKR